MKICVVGAGAIGGLMGVKLAMAGEDVTVIDQGTHLAAIQERGLKLIWEDGSEHVATNIKAISSLAEAGPQDLVILATKAHYLESVARDVPALMGPETAIVTVQNGIPWWYFHRHGGAFRWAAPGIPRSHRHPGQVYRRRSHHRLRRLSGGGGHRSRGDPPRGVRPVPDRRARRRGDRARQAIARCPGQRRVPVANHRRYPRRDLAQGVGQPVVQSDQRAHPRDPGGNLPVFRYPEAGRGPDGGGPGHRQQAGHPVPSHHREKDRLGGKRRRPQDLGCCRTWSWAARWRSRR